MVRPRLPYFAIFTRLLVLTRSSFAAIELEAVNTNTNLRDGGDDEDDEMEYGDQYTLEELEEIDRITLEASKGE